jgi:hypothetical protein
MRIMKGPVEQTKTTKRRMYCGDERGQGGRAPRGAAWRRAYEDGDQVHAEAVQQHLHLAVAGDVLLARAGEEADAGGHKGHVEHWARETRLSTGGAHASRRVGAGRGPTMAILNGISDGRTCFTDWMAETISLPSEVS